MRGRASMNNDNLIYDDLVAVWDYVNKHYEKWEELYEIPFDKQFDVFLLLQLRYDIIRTKPEHTKTKLDLIKMATEIQKSLKLKRKKQKENIIYIDCFRGDKNNLIKVNVYANDKLYVLLCKGFKIEDYALPIRNLITKKENAIIYIDTHGIGIGLYDELMKYDDLVVKQLEVETTRLPQ